MRATLFAIVCVFSSALFFSFLGLYEHLKWPVIDGQVLALLAAGVGSLILPFSKRLRVGTLFEFERELGRLKEKVSSATAQIERITNSVDIRLQSSFSPVFVIEIGKRIEELQRRYPGHKVEGQMEYAHTEGGNDTKEGVFEIGQAIEGKLRHLIASHGLRVPALVLNNASIQQMASYLSNNDVIDLQLLDDLRFFSQARNRIAHVFAFSGEEESKAAEFGTLIIDKLDTLIKKPSQP